MWFNKSSCFVICTISFSFTPTSKLPYFENQNLQLSLFLPQKIPISWLNYHIGVHDSNDAEHFC